MPHRLLPLFLLAALALLPACSAFENSPPDPGDPGPAPDLTVRQEPNDTVRVGQTVRLTAVFADSLRGYEVVWQMADRSTKLGRRVEWRVPEQPGTYFSEVGVQGSVLQNSTALTFRTYVLP